MMSTNPLEAFSHVAQSVPFYKKILQTKGIDPASIKTMDDFTQRVPVLNKKDIFPLFTASELSQEGNIQNIRSAILTSGTSGVFAYSLLTKEDEVAQREAIDSAFATFFNAEQEPPLIINALAMGVTFSSKHPVITTSVRADMVIHVVKTLSSYYKRTIIVADPYFAKKIIDDGITAGVDWPSLTVAFIVGGSLPSNNLLQYLLSRINGAREVQSNIVQVTMGLTELGLNIFSAPADLIGLRNEIQRDPLLLKEIFNASDGVCPEILYYMPGRMHIEIINPDSSGWGDIVISNLDMTALNPLIRYNTGDVGMFLDSTKITELLTKKGSPFVPHPGLPLIAMGGRHEDVQDKISLVAKVKEALFFDHTIAPYLSGNFKIQDTELLVHVTASTQNLPSIASVLEKNLATFQITDLQVRCLPTQEFGYDVDISYEGKWKYTLKNL